MKIANTNTVNVQTLNRNTQQNAGDKSFEDMINDKLSETSNTLPERAESSEKPEKTVAEKEVVKPTAKEETPKVEHGENYVAAPNAEVQRLNLQNLTLNTVSPQVNNMLTTAQTANNVVAQNTVAQSGEFVAAATNIAQVPQTNTLNAEVASATTPIIGEVIQTQTSVPVVSVDAQNNTANLNSQQTDTAGTPVLTQSTEQTVTTQQVVSEQTATVDIEADSDTQPVVTTQIEVKPLDPNNVNIKVADVSEANTQMLTQDVAEEISIKISENVQEFDIELNPANLGKINIKIEFTPERAIVSISSNNAQTQGLMAANAENIRQIIEANVGQQTMVTVQENSDMGQYRDNGDLQQESQNKASQEENQSKQTHDESIDFIQKLRLGLSDYV